MSYILHIESATDVCSVALGKSGAIVQERHSAEPRQHISHMSLLIDALLKTASLTYQNLSAVAVSAGPGSYTGLRVGYATAKGLCLALDIPLIEVDTLYSIAWGMKNDSDKRFDVYVPMIDARRMEVYSAVYDSNLIEMKPPAPWILERDELQEFMRSYPGIAFGGNGAFKINQLQLEVDVDNNLFISNIECNSSHLITNAWQQYLSGSFADLAYCEPRYLKPPNITKPKKVF